MVQTAFRIIIIAIIIAFVFSIIGTVFFQWTIDTSPYLSTFSSIIAIIVYVLPVGKLMPIISIFIASMVFRIAFSAIKAVWQTLPIRG